MLREEVEGIPEEQLRKALPGIINSPGAIAHHLCGNLRHFIGAKLGGEDFVRALATEFTTQLAKPALLAEIDETRATVARVLASLDTSRLADLMPDPPAHHAGRSVGYFLIQLCCHFERHWGQLNYLRRMLAAGQPDAR